MSAITIRFELSYPDAEHARLVFEAFSQWPTITVRKKVPDEKRMKAIHASMDYIGYQLPTIFDLVFEQRTCHLENEPVREGNKVKLKFYCGKRAGEVLWQALFDELTALPVTIEAWLHRDFDDSTEHRIESLPADL